VILVLLLLAACKEEVTHDNLDKWMQTENGPGKLEKALASTSIDPDLSAHAAENLMLIRDETSVREILDTLPEARRAQVLAKLGPRLWELARVEGEMTMPNDQQTAAKDLLADLRALADDSARATIDGYLIEWYTSGYYEARSETGRWNGAQVMRAIGKPAGAGMIKAASAVVAAPPTADGKRIKVGDKLLLGLAVTGDPDAVKFLLAIVTSDHVDKTLPDRAMTALETAYAVPPEGLLEKADPAALAPHVDAIGQIALGAGSSNRMVNAAVQLLVAAGPPHCLAPLVAMIDTPHQGDADFVWVGTDNALRCAGAEAIEPVARALPTSGSYDHAALEGSVVLPITKLGREQALAVARGLLSDKSWVARWIAIEVLAALESREDADKIAALGGDKAVLRGYWADREKSDPTLGKRATELAKTLRAR
jgi:hypothetical protein